MNIHIHSGSGNLSSQIGHKATASLELNGSAQADFAVPQARFRVFTRYITSNEWPRIACVLSLTFLQQYRLVRTEIVVYATLTVLFVMNFAGCLTREEIHGLEHCCVQHGTPDLVEGSEFLHKSVV
ncbi:hypothetical protein T265_11858 [Opisthorchis viverrini]|uniref:Uncharacterized protein n=1 Tax=Opisthorchis viverrini TaxID=6198 RepID=A0A074Z7W5_OPIVI|nr:hypothetical protein T265_11858 [Opisthorchis viverrini]KER19335.1 hypothetical protein T265_11858 [Opisthorchis viverrini]